MRWLFKTFLWLLLLGLLAVAGVAGFAWHWVHQPLSLPQETVDIRVQSGSGPGAIADTMIEQGIRIPRESFVWLARLSELDRQIKAGGYQILQGESLWDVLNKMARGDVTQRQVVFIEGWTIQQIIDSLARHPDVTKTIEPITMHDQSELARRLGLEQEHVEGLLFPDTYVFPVGTSDEEILIRALKAQQEVLERAWQSRAPDLPLKSPYEALILASIIEKETGRHEERARIAGVFINRLRLGMPLQTDPTVIYGMGEQYKGRIRRADLQRDTPWNTYTRAGLPPTPIAAVSRASLLAALNPEKHNFLYFVARGDGTSEFASTLAQHNRNVAKYILGR